MLLLWGPSRIHKELRNFCVQELITCLHQLDVHCSPQTDFQSVDVDEDSLLVSCKDPIKGIVEAACKCVLLTAVLQGITQTNDLGSLISTLRANSATLAPGNLRTVVLSTGPQPRTVARNHLHKELQGVVDSFSGHLHDISDRYNVSGSPTYWCLQLHKAGTQQYFFCTQTAAGRNGNVARAAPLYRGPTTMRSEIAALSANLAGVVRGSIVCDPCCGSGALLCACIAAGAIAALGSDMQPPECHHRDIRLRTDSFHDRLVADAALLSLRPYSLDAIITDPPYGRRATAHGSSAQNVEATWQSIVVALARVASDALVVGGKLLCWVPHDGYTEAWLREVLSPQCPVLRMTCYLPERRDAGLLRAVAVWKKCSMNDDGKAPFLVAKHMRGKSATACAKGVQREHTPDAAWSKQEQPVDRSQPYRQARAAANGARADIWRAAWMGDVGAVEEYLREGGDPNARDRKAAQTALQFAAGYGRLAVVERLLQGGADPEAVDTKVGMPALHRAAARGHTPVVATLLKHGADPHQRCMTGQTPLHYSAQFGHAGALQVLLAHVTGLGPSDLERALHAANEEGLTPLHAAAKWGMVEEARMLLVAGAPINLVSANLERVTAAHLGARWGHREVLALLKERGADLALRSAVGAEGTTPLEEATVWGRQACSVFLASL